MVTRPSRRREPVRPHLYVVDVDPRPAEIERGPGLERGPAEFLQREPDRDGRNDGSLVFRGIGYGLLLTAILFGLLYAIALLLNYLLTL